ncbi:MAG TPA: nitroreductase family protein [Acidimicrobiia bacterium]|nr:nitroreductase family protein [Acidimicrobiia bacterium]
MLQPAPEVYDAVTRLRVVRKFEDRPVSEEDLTAILEAGRWTGSSKNRQSWVFVVVRDRAQLDRLAECGDFTGPLRGAPLVIAPVRLPDGYDWDMGRVSQNMMLAAASLGVGSCPITLHRHDDARAVLGVPADHGCQWVVALGYPDEEAERASRGKNPLSGRKPLSELVRYDRF